MPLATSVACVLLLALPFPGDEPDPGSWENPDLVDAATSVAVALDRLDSLDRGAPPAEHAFVAFNLAAADRPGAPRLRGVERRTVDRFLMTFPDDLNDDPSGQRLLDQFTHEMVRQEQVLDTRLPRFGYPPLEGLVYLKLIEDIDAFARFTTRHTDPVSRVGGLTLFCRYMVLPLSYVSAANVAELRRSAAADPHVDVDATLNRWERESFRTMVATFRHEMIHVWTNTTLGVPSYADRTRIPVWFHEGLATYLSGDPQAALSPTYQEYQNAMFYLVERFGVAQMAELISGVLEAAELGPQLEHLYGVGDRAELMARSHRWHSRKRAVRSALWIVLAGIVVLALRGHRFPARAALLAVLGSAFVWATFSGFAERLYGLGGPAAVSTARASTACLAILGLLLAARAWRRWSSAAGGDSAPDSPTR